MTYPSPAPAHGHPRHPAVAAESSPTVPFRFRTPAAAFPTPPAAPHHPPFGGPGTPMLPPVPYHEGAARPPRRRRNRLVLAVAGGGAIVMVAGAAFGGVTWMRANSEKNQIEALVGDFAAAVNSGDPATVAQYLCADEAAALTTAVRGDQAPAPATHNDAVDTAPASAADIIVKGEVASASVTQSGADQDNASATTMYFAKEDGAWKVCAGAENDFSRAE